MARPCAVVCFSLILQLSSPNGGRKELRWFALHTRSFDKLYQLFNAICIRSTRWLTQFRTHEGRRNCVFALNAVGSYSISVCCACHTTTCMGGQYNYFRIEFTVIFWIFAHPRWSGGRRGGGRWGCTSIANNGMSSFPSCDHTWFDIMFHL